MEYSACVWYLLLGLLPASASFIDRITYSINSEFWKLRRSRRRRFSFKRWLREVRFTDILKEFALSCFIVMTLCVIYKTLYPIEEEASMILTVTKYGVYIALVGYVMLFLNTIGDAFADAYLVKVFKAVFKRINVFKMFSFSKNIPDETFDDIKKIADDEVKDKS